jgi:hypothetical protein
MKRFGIRMDGNETVIESIISEYIKSEVNCKQEQFRYLEIGAAGCITLRAVYDIVKENISIDDWKTIGLDLIDGWSLDFDETHRLFKENELEFHAKGISGGRCAPRPKCELFLEVEPRSWIKSHFYNNSIDICFVDGCHGAPCVKADFLAIQSKIKRGGYVIFHDAGEEEQGTDFQTHCLEFINVRQAIIDLGLDRDSNEWQFVLDKKGSRSQGSNGNGLWIVKKK